MEHDHSYKLLFSQRAMVEDLMRGFIPDAWVHEVDWSSLEKANASYITDDLRGRVDDVIWRVRWRGEWLYVYLLLEFQSSIDPFMAVRIMVYVGLLYQDLIRSHQWTADRRLPSVFPVVIYNGTRPWTAPVEVADLIVPVPGGLETYRPRLRYFLLDEGRLHEQELAPLQNFAAALFRLENSRTPGEIARVLGTLVEELKSPEMDELRRHFTTWVNRVLLPDRMPGEVFTHLNDLQEVRSMLAERVKEWTEGWKREGRQEGRQEGLQLGLQQGEALLLLRQLERRFGPLDEALRQRVRAADADTLLQWGERILTVNTLAEVMEE